MTHAVPGILLLVQIGLNLPSDGLRGSPDKCAAHVSAHVKTYLVPLRHLRAAGAKCRGARIALCGNGGVGFKRRSWDAGRTVGELSLVAALGCPPHSTSV